MSGNVSHQQGNAILIVSIIGFVAMATLGTASAFSVFAEGRAVQESLAETRSYWAAVGHANYVLSRSRQAGVCLREASCDNDLERVATFQAFFDEIATKRKVDFLETSIDYYINVSPVAAEAAITGKDPASGHLSVSLTYPSVATSPVPVLKKLISRLRNIELQFCVGLDATTSACNDPNVALSTDNFSGINRITALRRPTS